MPAGSPPSLVQQSTGPVVVVLDDYHVVTNPVIHAGVDQLLVEAPAALRLVIATRHDPPLALSRLRSHGVLREVRFDDLRFDADETAAVFARIAGATLPRLPAQRLVERTEGWVAAIQLVGLSAGASDDPNKVVDSFTADHRHVFDYFRDEVITSLSDRLRSFLVDTAVLERLCAPLCDAVTGGDDAQQLLEELERRNLFVLPLDQRRRWFRYHHLFADWLRLHVDDPVPRHRAAADWLVGHGYTGDAVRHLLAAGDTDRAAAVIEDQRWLLIGQGRGKTLRDWVHQLPPEALRSRPGPHPRDGVGGVPRRRLGRRVRPGGIDRTGRRPHQSRGPRLRSWSIHRQRRRRPGARHGACGFAAGARGRASGPHVVPVDPRAGAARR